ncbi:MAG: histidine phosphatase family protein [Acidimicrobiaceae bacterium]|nr:histidine phosphatase family protein [Acidimicrobiaceae bacterium]MYC41672.1 histidine phosphatase family protein [Acidimicrobiaceae bacterium]MYH88671.1 histidine phosphatase family protein [Acidimicrobiaceae bacterium]
MSVDLIIVRHGRPTRHVVDGEHETADPPLSELGHQQAKRTAEYLMNEGIDHVVASTMLRAHQTAMPLAEMLGLEVELIDDLKESDHRNKAYVPTEEMDINDPVVAEMFEGDLHETIFSDGLDAFEERVLRGFNNVIDNNRSKTVVAFCHGMTTMVFLRSILKFPDPLAMVVDYCSISRVQAAFVGIRSVRSINETHHVRDLIDW